MPDIPTTLALETALKTLPPTLQGLPPSLAKRCLGVTTFMETDLGLSAHGLHVLVGFSGGLDSTALLLMLRYAAPRRRITVSAAHLDHSLRPESAAEAEHCRSLCAVLGISFHTRRVDVAASARQHKIGIEHAARKARYAFFRSIVAETGCAYTVLGHQLDDLAEDTLMRFVRGAGWPGLSGMAALDERRKILRPLLLTPRSVLRDFLQTLGLPWVHDASNTDRRFLRNRVRMDMLPLLLRENPGFLENIANLWRLGRLDEALFASLLPNEETDPLTPASQLTQLPKALRLRLYKERLTALGSGQALLASLMALDHAWLHKKNGAVIQFPGSKEARVTAAGILWSGGASQGPGSSQGSASS